MLAVAVGDGVVRRRIAVVDGAGWETAITSSDALRIRRRRPGPAMPSEPAESRRHCERVSDDERVSSSRDRHNGHRHSRRSDKEERHSRHHYRHLKHASSKSSSPDGKHRERRLRHRYDNAEEERESKRHRRDRDGDEKRESSSSRRRLEDHRHRHRHRRHLRPEAEAETDQGTAIVDEDDQRRGPMAERYTEPGDASAQDAVASIPTSQSLQLQSHADPPAEQGPEGAELPKPERQRTQIRRDEWMISGEDQSRVQEEHGVGKGSQSDDFFSSLGTTGRQRAPKAPNPNPDELKISSRELNTQLVQGKHLDDYDEPKNKPSEQKLGGPGHQWRMMKLRRLYETADEEGRSVEDVAMERYGSMEAFNEARAERQSLDDQQQSRGGRRQGTYGSAASSNAPSRSDSPRSSANVSRPLSRQSSSFRKPGEASNASTPQPMPASSLRQSAIHRSGLESTASKPSTPIPSVFTPTLPRNSTSESATKPDTAHAAVEASQQRDVNTNPPLDPTALNKLSAKVMRAEMMGAPDASDLRECFEREKARAVGGGDKGFYTRAHHSVGSEPADSASTQVQVLPTLDAYGRLYDVGKTQSGGDKSGDGQGLTPGNRRRKPEKFETRDSKTGELLRYNADDDDQTLADLVREERFGAGSASQKNMDAELASRIAGDKSFKANVDYLDDNVERLGRKKMKSDAMKRQFAIQDFARTKKVLDTCTFCWQDDQPPKATVVSSGTRAFLALPDTEQFVPGHCLIVPMQHHLTSLDADEDTWEEIKNFMKCLMQMAAAQQQGVLFFETVKSLKQQRHTFIEAMPIEQGLFGALPGYFKQSIMEAGDEWSQNKKLIAFTAERPFRSAMVPQLPYFMVQFDHRGAKGYGHVIEEGDAFDGDSAGDTVGLANGDKGGSDFPRWFAAEVVGNLLEYEPRQWRKPRRLHSAAERGDQLARFKATWQQYDWTPLIQQQQAQAGIAA